MPLRPDFSRIDPHSLGMARVGESVRFLAKNGYPSELEEANARFEPGQVLTVAQVNIREWSSSYRFEGFGDATWNTVMFAPSGMQESNGLAPPDEHTTEHVTRPRRRERGRRVKRRDAQPL